MMSAPDILGPLEEPRDVGKAVILAAGRGRRMGRLTQDRPKAALEVDGHALLDWQIAALRMAGIQDIAVVTGHGAGALGGRDVTYIHNPHWASGTQVDTLLCARQWIGDDPVVVSYGDIIYHPSAALALLERPGNIVVSYDADHRWLWRKRFGNWLADSETFRLGPGQLLEEISGRPQSIDDLDGQFIGLMLFTHAGLDIILRHVSSIPPLDRNNRPDFTRILSSLLKAGVRIDTAVNPLPWIEVDRTKDLAIAQTMASGDPSNDVKATLTFPIRQTIARFEPENPSSITLGPDPETHQASFAEFVGDIAPTGFAAAHDQPQASAPNRPHRIRNAFAVQNWGRSGSTFVQSLFDAHPQVVSTPNFYSRYFFTVWARKLCTVSDEEMASAIVSSFRQWWDPKYVDATAGLHRLGPDQNQIAGVDRQVFEAQLRSLLDARRPLTRKKVFEAAHLAYALARGQVLADDGLQILFPVHGEPRAIACQLLETYPETRFIHTVRHPKTNLASSIRYLRKNNLDRRNTALLGALRLLFLRSGMRENTTITMFGDRAYLPYLGALDQVRTLRLEDLHASPEHVMKCLASWLEIEWHVALLQSSWDGKTWWNRPESKALSGFDSTNLDRTLNVELSDKDLRVLEPLLAAHADRLGYTPKTPNICATTLPWLIRLLAAWRAPQPAPTSQFRLAHAIQRAARFMPASAKKRAELLLERERVRNTYYENLRGAASVRASRSNRFNEPVRALIVLERSSEGYTARTFDGLQKNSADTVEDRLCILFADELWSQGRSSEPDLGLVAAMVRVGLSVHDWVSLRAAILDGRTHANRSNTPRNILS